MAKPKDKESLIQDITNRFRVTAREARDIVTAVGSANTAIDAAMGQEKQSIPVKKTIKNVVKQVGETARAATTGKKGTTSYKIKPEPSSMKKFKEGGSSRNVTYNISKPKKRK